MSVPPVFCVACIDYRFDAMTAEFFKAVGREYDFFLSTAAGGALALSSGAMLTATYQSSNVLELLKASLTTNLDIALTLQPIRDLFLMNHQDCGAMKAFLECSGYPNYLGENNKRELEVQGEVLAHAYQEVAARYPYKRIFLTLIDINGSVAQYNIEENSWTILHVGTRVGEGANDSRGLWFGLQQGETYTFEK
jgi:carbonic anhydrase